MSSKASIKLSKDTLGILKNCASICPNILIQPGQKINTIDKSQTTYACADVSENFGTQFAIYDLDKFLGILSSFDSPSIQFDDEENGLSKVCWITEGDHKVKYVGTSTKLISYPKQDIKTPEAKLTVSVTWATLQRILRQAAIFEFQDLLLHTKDNQVFLTALNAKDAGSNSTTVPIGSAAGFDFKLVFTISHLKLIEGDYKIEIPAAPAVTWINAAKKVRYIVPVHPSSEVIK